MKKRIISLLLGAAMAISMVGLGGCASSTEEVAAVASTEAVIEGENGDVYVDLTTGAVYRADRTVTAVEIPEKVDGVTIVAIEDSVFADKENLVEITLPGTLESIGQKAFSGTALTEITLPDSLITLDATAFAGTAITELVIPASVTTFESTSTGFNAVDTVTFLGQANVSNMNSQVEYSDYTSDNISPLFVIGALNPQEPQTIDQLDSDLRPFFISYEFTYAGIPSGATIYYEDASFEDIISKTFDQNGNQVYNWVYLGEEVALDVAVEETVAEQEDGIDTEEEAIAEVETSQVAAVTTETVNSAEMAQAYLDVLNELESRLGTWDGHLPTEYGEINGLAYSALLDFDGDGVDELYIVYADSTMYDCKLWQWNGSEAVEVGGSGGILFSSMYPSTTGVVQYGNQYILLHSSISGGSGGTYNENLVYTLRNGGLAWDWESRLSYSWDTAGMFSLGEGSVHQSIMSTTLEQLSTSSKNLSSGEGLENPLTDQQLAPYYAELEDFGFVVSNRDDFLPTVGISTNAIHVITQNGCEVASCKDTLYQMLYNGLDADELLMNLPYNGDISQINMSREQAAAFADVIEEKCTEWVNSEYSWYDYFSVGFIAADDGIPILVVYQYSGGPDWAYTFYQWNGSQAEEVDIESDYHVYDFYLSCESGTTELIGYDTPMSVGVGYSDVVFPLKNGQIDFDGCDSYYTQGLYLNNETWTEYWETIYESESVYYDIPDGLQELALTSDYVEYDIYLDSGEYTTTRNLAEADTFIQDRGNGTASYYLENGELVREFSRDINSRGINNTEKEDWVFGEAENTVSTLRAYATSNDYTYPEVIATTAELDAILDQLLAQFGGEIVGVYDLGNGIYYVIIDVSGTQKGGLICSYKENGKVTYRIEKTYQTPETQENLDNFVANYTTQTNVTLDFTQINKLETTEEFAGYIQSALDNMDGIAVTDSSKAELVTFIENAITTPSTVTVSGTSNVVNITPDVLSQSLTTAENALSTYENLLTQSDIVLNKGITVIVRIIGDQMNTGEAMEITLDSQLSDLLDDQILQILLGDSQHAIEISAENLKLLIAQYGTISIQIQRGDDGAYTLNFLDSNRNIIDQTVAPVTVFLPCENEFFTVMARYGTQIDNWGGQFSAVDNTISFSTPYTGIYELLDNSQTIADIADLPEETQNAIQFMISKGFFTLDDDGNFYPDEDLSRQDATKALVSMFFTLDRSLTCDFSDVFESSYYYSYIASAAADSIVLGYEDGTFQGENSMTTEELLAIVSRTLVEKKGYIYPENPEIYLSTIPGATETTDWAQALIALAIREGIIQPGEEIDPTAPVTREASALYLYRLFMLLEEVNPVAIDMDLTPAIPEITVQETVEIDAETEAIEEEAEEEIEAEENVEEKSNTLAIVLISIAGFGLVATPTALLLPKLLKKIKK